MNEWDENAIAEHLGGSLFRMTWDTGKCDVIDTKAGDVRSNKRAWTNEELTKLFIFKRRRHTIDELEILLDRERRRIQDKWAQRKNWLSYINVPDTEPEPSVIDQSILTLVDLDEKDIPQIRLEDIISAVCKVFYVEKNELCSGRRAHRLCEARHVYFWVARKFTSYTFPQIGRHCGKKDHSTVMHGVEKIDLQFVMFQTRIAAVLDQLGIKRQVAA